MVGENFKNHRFWDGFWINIICRPISITLGISRNCFSMVCVGVERIALASEMDRFCVYNLRMA